MTTNIWAHQFIRILTKFLDLRYSCFCYSTARDEQAPAVVAAVDHKLVLLLGLLLRWLSGGDIIRPDRRMQWF
jgi:hypothetical protein